MSEWRQATQPNDDIIRYHSLGVATERLACMMCEDQVLMSLDVLTTLTHWANDCACPEVSTSCILDGHWVKEMTDWDGCRVMDGLLEEGSMVCSVTSSANRASMDGQSRRSTLNRSNSIWPVHLYSYVRPTISMAPADVGYWGRLLYFNEWMTVTWVTG